MKKVFGVLAGIDVDKFLYSWQKNSGIFKCTSCHHEWQGLKTKPPTDCSWCGAKGALIGDAYSMKGKKS